MDRNVNNNNNKSAHANKVGTSYIAESKSFGRRPPHTPPKDTSNKDIKKK